MNHQNSIQQTEPISLNGWQNIGIMIQIVVNKQLAAKYRPVYESIICYSFGYCKASTKPYPTRKWSKDLNITERSFISHVHWLEENGWIKINRWTGYVAGGGSKPNTYSPVFPKNAKIFITDLQPKDSITAKEKEEYQKTYDALSHIEHKLITESIKRENTKRKLLDSKSKSLDVFSYFKTNPVIYDKYKAIIDNKTDVKLMI